MIRGLKYMLLMIFAVSFVNIVTASDPFPSYDEWWTGETYSIVEDVRYGYYIWGGKFHSHDPSPDMLEQYPDYPYFVFSQNIAISGISLVSSNNNHENYIEVITVPTELYNEKYDKIFPVRSIFPSRGVHIGTLIIPKEIDYYCRESSWAAYYDSLDSPFIVKEFVCENTTKAGLYSEDGVLFYRIDSSELPLLVQLPMLADRINYHYPEKVLWPSSMSYPIVYNAELRYPLIFSEKTENLDDKAFYYYPFSGIRIPDKFRNQKFDISKSKLKTFENFAISYSGNSETLEAIIVPQSNDLLTTGDLFGLYSKKSSKNNIKYIELRSHDLPEITEDISGYDWFSDFVGEIVTFVPTHLVDGYKKLKKDQHLPPNAIIEPTKDWIYLSPKLDNGQWVNKQSQFLYSACRFGNSEIVKEEWSSDNEQAALVDETGIVTMVGVGYVTITCTLTDQNEDMYRAKKVFYVTEKDLESPSTDVEEISLETDTLTINGVYNLQGFYLGKSLENLPGGIYIVNGKKVVVR